MTDFDYEVLQRKRLAYQAKYRKCGSKSKKCPLPSDRMTRRQWEKRCGEIMTYSMNEPVAWREFKAFPLDIQRSYIAGLIDRYHVNATDLGNLFGVTPMTVTRHCKDAEFGIEFPKGRRMSGEQKARFEAFLSGAAETEETVETEEVHDVETDVSEEIRDENPQPGGMKMENFSIEFHGDFDPDMIRNSLMLMVSPGTQCNITINVSIDT